MLANQCGLSRNVHGITALQEGKLIQKHCDSAHIVLYLIKSHCIQARCTQKLTDSWKGSWKYCFHRWDYFIIFLSPKHSFLLTQYSVSQEQSDHHGITSICSVRLLSNPRWWNKGIICLFQRAFPVCLLDVLPNALIIHLGSITQNVQVGIPELILYGTENEKYSVCHRKNLTPQVKFLFHHSLPKRF